MYVKIFEYGYDWEELLKFIQWWIKSDNFDKDTKIGDRVRGGVAIRDVNHTILIVQKGNFELVIEKGAIMSDGPPRELKKGELYLNKWLLGTGFDKSVKQIKNWLEKMGHYNPHLMNPQKADRESKKFDLIGTGFFIETPDFNTWHLRIVADVVGLPK
jgi:hypothetical protein